jgi:hypothetical protein
VVHRWGVPHLNEGIRRALGELGDRHQVLAVVDGDANQLIAETINFKRFYDTNWF